MLSRRQAVKFEVAEQKVSFLFFDSFKKFDNKMSHALNIYKLNNALQDYKGFPCLKMLKS